MSFNVLLPNDKFNFNLLPQKFNSEYINTLQNSLKNDQFTNNEVKINNDNSNNLLPNDNIINNTLQDSYKIATDPNYNKIENTIEKIGNKIEDNVKNLVNDLLPNVNKNDIILAGSLLLLFIVLKK